MDVITWNRDATIEIACTSTSSSVAITTNTSVPYSFILVSNEGADTAFIEAGVGAQTASSASPTASIPVLAGQQIIISVPAGTTHVAGVCKSTKTATVYVTPGS